MLALSSALAFGSGRLISQNARRTSRLVRWAAEQLAALKDKAASQKPVRKKPVQAESKIQSAFIAWVRRAERTDWRLRTLFSVPNGGKRGARTAAMMRLEGQRPGMPDTMLPIRSGEYIGLAIEFKRPNGGVASTLQKEMMELLTQAGWRVVIHTDVAEAVDEVKNYLKK